MSATLAFLRAVNVGSRRFPAADIRRVVEGEGFTDVATHINTGNVFFRGGSDRADVEGRLETAFASDRGFDVPVISFTPREFRAIRDDAEGITSDSLDRHYVYLLKRPLTTDEIRAIAARDVDTARTVVSGRAAHVLIESGYQVGRVDPTNVAKLFGVATNRNLNVVRTLAATWASD